jgi:hypothetical protein
LLRAGREARVELGGARRPPLERLREVIPTADFDLEDEARVLTLRSTESGASVRLAVEGTLRFLEGAGVEVRKVSYGRSLESALTSVAASELTDPRWSGGGRHDGQ